MKRFLIPFISICSLASLASAAILIEANSNMHGAVSSLPAPLAMFTNALSSVAAIAQVTVAAVPEPAAIVLFSLVLLGGSSAWRKHLDRQS